MLGYEQKRRQAVGTKQQILKAIEELPDDAGVEEALDRLYLLYKVERGLRQADNGELISSEEVRQRMAKWLK
jgi:predicted transcriptional regulator